MIPALHIGNLVARVPIVQGGMGVGISLAGLAAAVANQGGIGVISSIGLGVLHPSEKCSYAESNLRALREEIRKARRQSSGIIGLNVMVAVSDFDDIVTVALEEKVDVLFLGAGLPLKMPKGLSMDYLSSCSTRIVPIVSSSRAAKLIFRYWDTHYHHIPDGVVVEGPLAGGHLGFSLEQIADPSVTLEGIVPEVKEVLSFYQKKYNKQLSLIAGGGIFNGDDIYRMLQLGADGVQMGTRFVATHECDATSSFKDAYVQCNREDVRIIKSPVGLPGRAIINRFLLDAAEGKRLTNLCPWKCLKTCNIQKALYCIADALKNACMGNLDKGFCFAGANAWRVTNVTSVKELIDGLMDELKIAFATKGVVLSG